MGFPLNSDRPRIGITVGSNLSQQYYEAYRRAVEAAGADVVFLPVGSKVLDGVDGLLLPGGADINPANYHQAPDPKLGVVEEELDRTELELFRQARERRLPVLGICRGQQLINVAMGGSLIQHIEDHEVRVHGRSYLGHRVDVEPSSELGSVVGQPSIPVNSLHHQAIDELAPGLRSSAHGEDGVIEGVETDDGLVVAVQCHPEELSAEEPWARWLFESFVARASRGAKR
ncbi:MAG TPA: gamma-glutamyl-gamma-aminobutyrate hydrolase family protein [Candidatus Dormibacteraeota bacterium]|nr:gamma-glutamyl-gamma-aminobutyrate hydrolase family protein [Candidatus Dormibacteraeota bacterium]